MKINGDFMIREIAGDTILVATGQASQNFNGMITLNEVGAFILQKIEECKNENELISKILDEFEVDKNIAREDTKEFIEQLLKMGIVLKNAD